MPKALTYKAQDTKRNYQIDFLKLICAFLVVINHTQGFNIQFHDESWFSNLGWVSVHIFFTISGFLMVKSLKKHNADILDIGKFAFDFVKDKFKRIALPFWIATLMLFFMQYIYIHFGWANENSAMGRRKHMGLYDKSNTRIAWRYPIWNRLDVQFPHMVSFGYVYCNAPLKLFVFKKSEFIFICPRSNSRIVFA